jgi:hypothetical protein
VTTPPDSSTPDSGATDNGAEILRIWTSDAGERVVLRVDLFPPGAWGIILVDVAKHVARAYAQQGQMTANEAFAQVLSSFIAEIGQATDTPQPG